MSQALLDYEQSKPHVATGNAVGRPAKTQTSRAFDAAEAFAKTQGFEPKHGTLNKFLSTVIYEVNRYGIEQQDALAEAKERYFYYGDGERGITSVVKSIYETKQSEWGTLRLPSASKAAGNKTHRATSADIEAFLLSQGTYRHLLRHGQPRRLPDRPDWQSSLAHLHGATLYGQSFLLSSRLRAYLRAGTLPGAA